MESGASFNHQTIVLDGETYSDCTFTSCRLVYSGGEVPIFENCRFERCEWKHDDASARTLSYLKLMWGVGAKAEVQATIKEITVVGR
jgi:hypothetical protein